MRKSGTTIPERVTISFELRDLAARRRGDLERRFHPASPCPVASTRVAATVPRNYAAHGAQRAGGVNYVVVGTTRDPSRLRGFSRGTR